MAGSGGGSLKLLAACGAIQALASVDDVGAPLEVRTERSEATEANVYPPFFLEPVEV